MTEREQNYPQIADFRLPRYGEIPDVGLYLEQVTRYLAHYLSPIQGESITNSMISNYVKKHLLANPVKKQYHREQIAYLVFIAVAKNVLSLDHIHRIIQLQQETYPSQTAYDYFCDELENILQYVFGLTERPKKVGQDSTREKQLLRNTIIAVCYKIYLEKSLEAFPPQEE